MSKLTIVGDPESGASMPRLAHEIAALRDRWTTVQVRSTVPSSGSIFIALAESADRAAMIESIDADRLVSLIHPNAVLSPSATIGRNVLVGPQAVVMMDAVVADGVVANSLSSIEHDNRIGFMTFLGTGAILCGGVTTGERAFIGGGAVVKPGVSIGPGCTVGTGAVVIGNTEPESVVVGNPARPLRRT